MRSYKVLDASTIAKGVSPLAYVAATCRGERKSGGGNGESGENEGNAPAIKTGIFFFHFSPFLRPLADAKF